MAFMSTRNFPIHNPSKLIVCEHELAHARLSRRLQEVIGTEQRRILSAVTITKYSLLQPDLIRERTSRQSAREAPPGRATGAAVRLWACAERESAEVHRDP